MLRSGQTVIVKGFFAVSRVGVVINPGSWWSGLCHIMFEGDQVVTAVPRRCVTHEVEKLENSEEWKTPGENFDKFKEYCSEDVKAELIHNRTSIFSSVAARPNLQNVPRKTGKPPVFATPYGNDRTDFMNGHFKNRHHVVDMKTGRVMKWLGAQTIPKTPGGSLYGCFECRNKVIQIPIADMMALIESRQFVPYPSSKKAREAIQAVDVREHFKPGVFVIFDGSFCLYHVDDIIRRPVDEVMFILSLRCDDEKAKPFKMVSLDGMTQSFRSGHTVIYPDYHTAIKDLKVISPLSYFDSAEENEEL